MITQNVLDGQKIQYHTDVLEQWLAGGEVWPVYFEVGPTAACNCSCVFCAYDYLQHGRQYIGTDALRRAITCLAEHGGRSCMFAGEGEPLMHPDIADIITHAHGVGLDVAMTTNLLAADEKTLTQILPHMQWIRCSCNATNAAEYDLIHRGPKDGFAKVWRNLETALTLKRRHGWGCTLGVQCIVLADNIAGLPDFAARLSDLGVDYLSLKPCIQHPKMSMQVETVSDEQWNLAIQAAREKASAPLTVIARETSRDGVTCAQRGYDHCLALPFFVEIISDGRVFSCGPMLGDDRFCYGNINEQSFEEIWRGPRRQEIVRFAEQELDVHQCMRSCRLDQINVFLHQLQKPPAHVNFI